MTLSAPSVATKEAILTAARALFAERGFDAAPVQEIASRADVNKALIYYYFEDKEALYREVLQQCYSPILAIWDEPAFPQAGTPTERLIFFLRRFIEQQEANEDYRRIFAHELTRGGKHIEWLARNYVSKNRARLTEILSEGVERGEFRPVDPRVVIDTLIGAVIFHFVARPVTSLLAGKEGPPLPSVRELSNSLADLLLDGLRWTDR